MIFPAAPLYAFVPPGNQSHGHNNVALAAALDLPIKTVRQWQFRGLCTLHADQVAVRLGLHPSIIWPDWFASVADEPRCRWCGEATIVNHYCSKACIESAAVERKWMARNLARWWDRLGRYRTFPPLLLDLEEQAA